MIRAPMGNDSYWTAVTDYGRQRLRDEWATISKPSANPAYLPQYVFDVSQNQIRYLLVRYSAGAPVKDLAQFFTDFLDAWQRSNRLSKEVCQEHNLQTCRDWDFSLSNLNHYNWCFWLVGLALSLKVPDEQWERLLALIGGEGEDVLLDRVIARRSPGRGVGTILLHPKPYSRLLKAVDGPKDRQAALLRDFVDHWYAELKRPAPKIRKAPTIQPFWYVYGDPEKHPLEKGSYFGRWCIEAVAAVKAFGMDDSRCLGHEHYPGDLLRPDGPSTHPEREERQLGWFARLWAKRKT